MGSGSSQTFSARQRQRRRQAAGWRRGHQREAETPQHRSLSETRYAAGPDTRNRTSNPEGGAAWHGDCAIFSRWWSAPAAPAVGVRGSIPRVGPRGIACLTETPVLRGFSLALMPSPPASRLPPPLPLTRTEGLATATTH